MDQQLLTGLDVERLAENLLGGERGYREGGRRLPASSGRLVGQQPAGAISRGAHVPWPRSGTGCVITASPGAQPLAAWPTASTVPTASTPSAIGGLAPHVPATGADELVPVGHAGRPHFDQYLVRGQRSRLA
jgi:hypothetical protein